MQTHVRPPKSGSMACFLVRLALVIAFPVACGSAQDLARTRRPVTVRDAIEMMHWADRDYFLGGDPEGRVGIFSPDKKEFLVVVRKGNVQRDTNDCSLLLFQTRNAFTSSKPEVLLTMSSRSNGDAISHVRWLEDGNEIVFLGENRTGMARIYRFDIRTRTLSELTHHPTPILAYDIDASGNTIVYEAAAPHTSRTEPGAVSITNQSPTDLVAYDCQPADALGPEGAGLFLQVRRRPARRISSADFIAPTETLSLAPNGRYALLGTYVRAIPERWREYKDAILGAYLMQPLRRGMRSNVRRYALLDIRAGTLSPLVDTPISGPSNAFRWTRDSGSIVLSGVYLPLDISDSAERELRKSQRFVVEIRLPQREIVKITDHDLRIERWEEATGRLVLTPNGPARDSVPEAYEKRESAWRRMPMSEGALPPNVPLAVTLEEDMNTPPRIFVSDAATKRKALLLDLNPQFARLSFGRVETIRWKATDGTQFEGGLYLPPDYRPGVRYPLVIQTHGFRQDRFWIDGPWSSAFAGQPLAARGMVVLQVGGSVDPSVEVTRSQTAAEAPTEMFAYEGAIDELDRRGFIDRTRVGVIGFSRTVYYVEYTLTHSKYDFRAASLADGIDGGYVNYMLWPLEDYPRINGAGAFGHSLSTWLENSPGFNLDRVRAPVHLEYYGRAGFLGGWQWYSGLSLLGKPVDYVWLPDAAHLLIKPSDRMASQQNTVDWFRFWLLDEEDSDPAKKERYQEWEHLRGLETRVPGQGGSSPQ